MYTEDIDVIQYDKIRYINPFTLISEVKKYPAIYNVQSPGYENRPLKDEIWESIHDIIFPNYKELNDETRVVIKETVRNRWKTLRAAFMKDYRLRKKDPEYCKKRMNPKVKQMQFLLPFVKYTRRTQRRTPSIDGKNSPDSCNIISDSTIDLTMQEDPEDSCVLVEDGGKKQTDEALNLPVHLGTSIAEPAEVDLKDGICVSAPNVYNNSTLKYMIREVEEREIKADEIKTYKIEIKAQQTDKNAEETEVRSEKIETETKKAEIKAKQTERRHKRKRTDSEDDLHSKITELIDRCNEDSLDEDRMFLMSLLSDFKRVPVRNKLKVKSAIITALYAAFD